MRAALVIALIALGCALILVGLSIELDIHSQLESGGAGAGLRRFIVRRFASQREQLLNWRLFAHVCVVVGPIVLGAAYFALFTVGKRRSASPKGKLNKR
jgi:hypothetical protein